MISERPGRIEIMPGGPSQNELIHALDMTILCNGLIEHVQLKRFLYSYFVQAFLQTHSNKIHFSKPYFSVRSDDKSTLTIKVKPTRVSCKQSRDLLSSC